jgi:hypothetical protein
VFLIETNKMTSLKSVCDNLYVPPAQVEELAAELGKKEDETRKLILENAVKLADVYNANGSKSFWTNSELCALNVLLLNKCLQRKDAETATNDVERFELVLQPFADRLEYLLSEKKFASFQRYIAEVHDEIGIDNFKFFKQLVEKCKVWLASKTAVIPETPDDATLYKQFMNVCKKLGTKCSEVAPKRLDFVISEMDKVIKEAEAE